MGKKCELSLEIRAQIKILKEQKMSQSRIASILNISQSAVSRCLARIKEMGSMKSRKRQGRPRVTTAAGDRRIRRAAVKHPTWSSVNIAVDTRAG